MNQDTYIEELEYGSITLSVHRSRRVFIRIRLKEGSGYVNVDDVEYDLFMAGFRDRHKKYDELLEWQDVPVVRRSDR